MKYQVEKILDGYSVCFRQWQARHSHCCYLHGYALYFKLCFEARTLDEHQWVWDFAWLKNCAHKIEGRQASDWFAYMFDHTVLAAEDDPELASFQDWHRRGLIQLRVLPEVSCERIAGLILDKVGNLVARASDSRVRLRRVAVYEHEKNCALAEDA